MADQPTSDYLNMDINTIKTALRIDGNADDTLIQSYIDAAKLYVADAINGDIDSLINKNKFRLAVILLVQFWYSNRTTDMQKTPYQVLSLIQQLRGELWN